MEKFLWRGHTFEKFQLFWRLSSFYGSFRISNFTTDLFFPESSISTHTFLLRLHFRNWSGRTFGTAIWCLRCGFLQLDSFHSPLIIIWRCANILEAETSSFRECPQKCVLRVSIFLSVYPLGNRLKWILGELSSATQNSSSFWDTWRTQGWRLHT